MRWTGLFLFIVFIGCTNKDVPDVSHIKADVTVHRFDRDFFGMDTSNITRSLLELQEKYPAFLTLYFKYFAPVADIANQYQVSFDSAVVIYYSFIKPLAADVAKKFPDLKNIENQLEEKLRYVKFYFPDFNTPAVITTVESLNPENPNEIYGTSYYQDTLIISLQMFLGEDDPRYDPKYYPDYIRRRFKEEFVVPNSIRAIVGEIYPDSSQGASLIEQMIEKGKQWWLMRKFLPETPDSLITGYNSRQMEWVQNEEANIWGYLNQNENLYSIEQSDIQMYVGEGPFTQTLPHGNSGEGAPGNIGPWIGWQIVKRFEEKNPDLTVQQILQTPAKKLFNEAKYKPK